MRYIHAQDIETHSKDFLNKSSLCVSNVVLRGIHNIFTLLLSHRRQPDEPLEKVAIPDSVSILIERIVKSMDSSLSNYLSSIMWKIPF